jgi:hypothetical protein
MASHPGEVIAIQEARNQEDATMHTGLTADAEIRRLKQLGEAKHDWCESCQHTEQAPTAPIVRWNWRVFSTALARLLPRRSPAGAVVVAPQQ